MELKMPLPTQMRSVGAGLTAVLVLTAGSLLAQDATPSRSSSKPGEPTARRANDPSRKVPPYFGQIGLTLEQKETIYKLQGKHQAKIDELEKQIAAIETQMLEECEGVLTDAQKQMLS